MKKSATHPDNSSGFTIVEIMLTVVVFFVGIIGVTGSMYVAMDNHSNTRERYQVSRALCDLMETIGDTPFGEILTNYDGQEFVVPCATADGSCYAEGQTSPTNVRLQVQIEAPEPDLIEVTISGSLNDGEAMELFQEFGQ